MILAQVLIGLTYYNSDGKEFKCFGNCGFNGKQPINLFNYCQMVRIKEVEKPTCVPILGGFCRDSSHK